MAATKRILKILGILAITRTVKMPISKIFNKCLLSLFLVQTFSCTSFEFNNPYHREEKGSGGYTGSYGSVSHGGKSYKTVKIGTQTWMAENLNYDVEGSKCYGDHPANCDKYGRLYDWATAMALPSSCNNSECGGQVQPKHKGICPSGWHIPSDDDWTTLVNSAGGEDVYGFAALPGGYGDSDGGFGNAGNYGYWWSSSESNAYYAFDRYMGYLNEGVYRGNNDKTYLFSVRCLQDSAP